jgi:hypothetical protein
MTMKKIMNLPDVDGKGSLSENSGDTATSGLKPKRRIA